MEGTIKMFAKVDDTILKETSIPKSEIGRNPERVNTRKQDARAIDVTITGFTVVYIPRKISFVFNKSSDFLFCLNEFMIWIKSSTPIPVTILAVIIVDAFNFILRVYIKIIFIPIAKISGINPTNAINNDL